MDYRLLTTIDELETVVDLQAEVWGLDIREAVPSNILVPIVRGGGMALGAFDDGQMIGFAFGLPLRHAGEWSLLSHMTGVLPHYQGQAIGFALKQQQRIWALDNGYTTIHWTYDPMRRGNANFNLRRLGTTASSYHINRYGDMRDSINAGMPSDRLEVVWSLNDSHVNALAAGERLEPIADTGAFLVSADGDDITTDLSPLHSGAPCRIEIPRHLAALKQKDINRAKAWQLAIREAFTAAFATNYAAVDFETIDERCWYILQRN